MNGILCVDKPAGMTSFGVISRLRRLTGERRIGHAGTLDPMATGVLPVFLGQATRAISLLPVQDKAYDAVLKLGLTTDTGDTTGKVLSTAPVTADAAQVREAAKSFLGRISQVPPMYSALKVDGQRLYDLARQGIEVERKPREIRIDAIEMLFADEEKKEYGLSVRCTKGTYIRTLCEDIGRKLGCGAIMSGLRRTSACGFEIDNAFTLEALERRRVEGSFSECLLRVEAPFEVFPQVEVTQRQAVRFLNGGALSAERLPDSPERGLCRVKRGQQFLGLAELIEGEARVRLVWREEQYI